MIKSLGVFLALSVFVTSVMSCASTEIVKVEATDGEVVNVRAEKDEPTALDAPMTWGDYLLLTLISLGISLASAAIIAGQVRTAP